MIRLSGCTEKHDKCFTAADHRSLILSLALLTFSFSYMIINDLLRGRSLDQTSYNVGVDCLMWDVFTLQVYLKEGLKVS